MNFVKGKGRQSDISRKNIAFYINEKYNDGTHFGNFKVLENNPQLLQDYKSKQRVCTPWSQLRESMKASKSTPVSTQYTVFE
jgi:hypothetical protein